MNAAGEKNFTWCVERACREEHGWHVGCSWRKRRHEAENFVLVAAAKGISREIRAAEHVIRPAGSVG